MFRRILSLIGEGTQACVWAHSPRQGRGLPETRISASKVNICTYSLRAYKGDLKKETSESKWVEMFKGFLFVCF